MRYRDSLNRSPSAAERPRFAPPVKRDPSPPAGLPRRDRLPGTSRKEARALMKETGRKDRTDRARTAAPRLRTDSAAARLDRDPAQLGELVDHRLAAEAAVAGRLDAAERHLRLVVHGRAVDVADAGCRSARPRRARAAMSRLNTAADRPYSVSLATRIASSSPSTRTIGFTGPNDLLAVDAHRGRHVVEHGRLDDRAVALAAGDQPWPPCRPRRRSARPSRSAASAVDQRAEHDMPARIAAGSAAARLASLSTNSSATFSSTMSRSVDMQIWPWLAKAPKTAAFTASSRSASSSTISGALPPSSSSTGFRCSAASLAMILPTRSSR